jgi:hypothetical protein
MYSQSMQVLHYICYPDFNRTVMIPDCGFRISDFGIDPQSIIRNTEYGIRNRSTIHNPEYGIRNSESIHNPEYVIDQLKKPNACASGFNSIGLWLLSLDLDDPVVASAITRANVNSSSRRNTQVAKSSPFPIIKFGDRLYSPSSIQFKLIKGLIFQRSH